MDRLTVVQDDEGGAPSPPSRSGQPWTDEDYQALVAAVRAGKDLDEIAAAVGRGPRPVEHRLVRMLPVEERGCLLDRVLPTIRDHLADPGYDWRAALLQTPPPRPIVHEERVLTGFPGLDDEDLVTIADALLAQATPRAADTLGRLDEQVGSYRVWDRVTELTAERVLRRHPDLLDPHEAYDRAAVRVSELRRLALSPRGDGYTSTAPGVCGRRSGGGIVDPF